VAKSGIGGGKHQRGVMAKRSVCGVKQRSGNNVAK